MTVNATALILRLCRRHLQTRGTVKATQRFGEEFAMRIVIFGTGGAGGYFGAQLARAGEDIVFIARGEHLYAIRTNGLRVEQPTGEIIIRPAQATDDPSQVTDIDAIIVGVKAWQVPAAAEAMRTLIGPETFVVPLQNGVEAPSLLAAALGRQHVLVGLCGTLSWVVAPGRIRNLGGLGFVKFGEIDNSQTNRVKRLRDAFAKSGVKVEVPADITRALWEKFLFVTAIGGVGAMSRAPIGVIRTIPETRRLLEQCMAEVLAVARARKIALSDTVIADTMGLVDAVEATGTTSLQRDITDGKPTELEFWNGAVSRLAREVAVATPLHDFIYSSLLPQELRARGKVAF
jgi:2-dehydropantoate 2-reductase